MQFFSSSEELAEAIECQQELSKLGSQAFVIQTTQFLESLNKEDLVTLDSMIGASEDVEFRIFTRGLITGLLYYKHGLSPTNVSIEGLECQDEL